MVAKEFSVESFTLASNERMLTKGCEQAEFLTVTAEQCSDYLIFIQLSALPQVYVK